MANKDEQGRWIDGSGNAIPVKYIDQVDKRRDRMVEKIFRHAEQTQDRVVKLKTMVMHEINLYLDWLAIREGVDALNPGGNYRLNGFSCTKRIELKVGKFIEFDERLQIAKQKLDNCLERWSTGADDKLKAVVFEAFKVDKKGKIDVNRILGLRKLKIKDTEWNRAMELIGQAIVITGSKNYLVFQHRDQGGEWQTIKIDLAAVDVEVAR